MGLGRIKITRDLAFDYGERLFLSVLCGGIVLRLLPTLADNPMNLLLVVSETAAVVMIVLRRPAQQTDLSAYAVLVALAGTAGGLLVRPGGDPLVAGWIAGLMMVTGILFNISAKVSLNRSFGMTAANRGVKRQGPYRLMRHPMYVGYAITQLGFLLMNPTLWNLSVYAIAWTAQLLRIGAEERVLNNDPEYRAYAGAVRYRLVPGLY